MTQRTCVNCVYFAVGLDYDGCYVACFAGHWEYPESADEFRELIRLALVCTEYEDITEVNHE